MPAGSKQYSLAQIAQHIGADIVGPFATPVENHSAVWVSGLGSLGSAKAGDLTHLSGASYRPLLAETQASAVILSAADAASSPCPSLVVAQPYLSFARASQLFEDTEAFAPGIHPSAVVDPSAVLGEGVCLGPNVVIAANVILSANVVIQANCSVGKGSAIGANSVIYPSVSVYPRVSMGAGCTVHSGVVLGAAGFGYTPDERGHFATIAQIGGVRIGNNVSIGAGTTIDCGAIDDTVVGDGVKIDNQVQIGHNCKIGDHTLICGCVGIAGSTEIGSHCMLAGGSGVGGQHPIKICDQVIVSVRTTVSQSIDRPGVYSGSVLATEHNKWLRNAVKLSALSDLFNRVKKLENGNRHE
ncbi:MAG: UDP-3-O-(3-hydroxymyristoyl)glucosamine N-acyltransferase [Proteobacteria bacterium]|nr:UDP-3-O-(3-hydroxymyristoyl)glucosamine N-acyltransferase [Pseudomonadota bacterium]